MAPSVLGTRQRLYLPMTVSSGICTDDYICCGIVGNAAAWRRVAYHQTRSYIVLKAIQRSLYVWRAGESQPAYIRA